MEVLKGIGASPGIAIGPIFLHDPEDFWVDYRRVPELEIQAEIDRFEGALLQVAEDVELTRAHVEEKLGPDHAQIFDAHLLMLEDAALKGSTIQLIQDKQFNAEYAFWQIFQKLRKDFDAIEDEFFRDRKADLLNIGKRVLARLCGHEDDSLNQLNHEAIVVASDLTPSETAHLPTDYVLGVVAEVGGATSHTAILTRSLGIPAVVGAASLMAHAQPGDLAIVDGSRERVFLNPDSETLDRYRKEGQRFREHQIELISSRDLLSETLDGYRVQLHGNIELPQEVEAIQTYGAEGVGLYRTEFLYMDRNHLPTEEEQAEVYSRLAEELMPYPLVVRTLDLGGDKLAHFLPTRGEANPFLGWRAIRLSLANRPLFETQLRAILRAGSKGDVRLMFPLISSMEELLEAKAVLADVQEALQEEGVPFDPDYKLGVMIEVPSAALIADQLAGEVDFFSIGTNDLIQYTLAVDRGNEKVAYLYDPLQPSVLRLIQQVADVGFKYGVPVTVCGEMAGDPCCSILLMGLGVGSLSMSPRLLPEVKQAIRSLTFEDAQELARTVLSLKTRKEIRDYLKGALPADLGEMLPNALILEGEG